MRFEFSDGVQCGNSVGALSHNVELLCQQVGDHLQRLWDVVGYNDAQFHRLLVKRVGAPEYGARFPARQILFATVRQGEGMPGDVGNVPSPDAAANEHSWSKASFRIHEATLGMGKMRKSKARKA